MIAIGPDRREGYKKTSVEDGYDKWSSSYDQTPNPLIALEENVTLQMIGDVRGRSVLDLGCGTGRYCALLAKRGAEVIGVDQSYKMLDCAKEKIVPGCQFKLVHSKIENMPFPNEHFDIVISALTLCHVQDLEPALSESSRVLKPGGSMVISDIHPYWPLSGHDYTEFFDKGGQEYRIPVYTHNFEDCFGLFKKCGLQLEAIRELKIDSGLVGRFPSLKDYANLPLAVIFKLRKF